MSNITNTIEQFYRERLGWVPNSLQSTQGHFNVFDIAFHPGLQRHNNSYQRKDFYKIKLLKGWYRIHYGDKSVEINGTSLFFVNPYVPNRIEFIQEELTGIVCVFTESFFSRFGSFKEYPLYQPGGNPVVPLQANQEKLFLQQMHQLQVELESGYLFKYDMLRTLTLAIIHEAQKISLATQPNYQGESAGSRLVSKLVELLERQFPIESPHQRVQYKSANEFAELLSVHINHLNKSVKQITGRTTSQLIAERWHQEARSLLLHTDWDVAEIGYCLGYEDISYFITLFKRLSTLTPQAYRMQK